MKQVDYGEKMKTVTLSDFLNSEYREYAIYTVHNRAIPHLIDGFKPVHRKILFTALPHCKSQWLKTSALGGYTMAESNYNHGDASIESAINLMAQNFVGANNLPMFLGEGHFGNRLIPDAAAGRYTSVKINPDALSFFKDFDILDANEDLDNPEPLTYLPIIPWILVNGIEGIAVGFSTKIFPRSVSLLKHVLKIKLKNPTKKYPYEFFVPHFNGFNGKIVFNPENNNWTCTGIVDLKTSKTVIIKEIPIGYTHAKMVKILERLISDKIVRDYQLLSTDDGIFSVDFYRDRFPNSIQEAIDVLKLEISLNENLTVLTPDDKLVTYNSPDDMINDFIKYRLDKYNVRIDRNLQMAKDEICLIDEKVRFIKSVYSKEIIITELTKDALKQYLIKTGYKYVDEIINSKIYHYTKDVMHELLSKRDHLVKTVIPHLESTTPTEEWVNDLTNGGKNVQ